ncbi:hypothetical protein E2C01_085497 [Portunus trituberculatus]|uniref:Uncharacterized protein n=1 Tax=Portunus trituberculatus TaxID=210409 RepID=A0A5B7JC35_PORTR|nr:hypothetical protein [Portunus trituberculatus]
MSQVRRYGLKMSPFRTCYFRTFEKFSALRTSASRLVVRRYGGAEVRTKSSGLSLPLKYESAMVRSCMPSTPLAKTSHFISRTPDTYSNDAHPHSLHSRDRNHLPQQLSR